MELDVTLPTREPGNDVLLTRFDMLPPGGSFVLLTSAPPRDALSALQQGRSDRFDWNLLEDGPPQWRIEVRKRDSELPRGPDEYLTWDHRRLDALLERVRRSLETGSASRPSIAGSAIAAAAPLFE